MRLTGDPAAPRTMSSGGSGNFLLVPIPEYPPLLDCVPNKTVKIVVLGASNVGKTALIVRFLTKRFIGDYEANTGALYSRKVTLDGEEVSLQIQDTPCVALQVPPGIPLSAAAVFPSQSFRVRGAAGQKRQTSSAPRTFLESERNQRKVPKATASFPALCLKVESKGKKLPVLSQSNLRKKDDAEGLYCQEQINRSIYWADGYVLVFSITDHNSYRTIQPLYQHVRRIHPSGNIPVILVGNKSDLLRARQVPADEGETLAASLGGVYFEASAREDHEGVHGAFLHLCQEVIRALGGGNGEKRRGGLHLARPKSPNMQELKRRFRQVLSSKVKSATTL